MPAVRTLKGKRSGEDAFQLTWTAPTPPEPAAEPAMSFSFAPNVTPCTFIAPPPSEDEEIPSEESSLFPEPMDGLPDLVPPPTSSKRRKKSSKSSTSPSEDGTAPIDGDDSANPSSTPAHIPRPPNAFILFRSSFIRSQHVSAQIEGNHGTLSKIVGMVWHSLPFREREVWQAKARKALAEHKRKYPGYSFRPAKDKAKGGANGGGGGVGGGGANGGSNGSGGGGGLDDGSKRDGSAPPAAQKRKQREVGPRDVARCEQIAALLSKGLKGKALEEAIAEFDASRAPVVITPRFEVPITAQQYEGGAKTSMKEEDMSDERPSVRRYRRSSSAPLLEVDSKASQFMRPPSPTSPFTTSPFSASPPRPQSTSASPPTPTAAQIPNNNNSTPTFRTQRKRSTSSSPPMRHRTLQAQASLPSMGLFQQQQAHHPPHLTLTTSLSAAQLQAYQASQPLSAPVLARQDASSPLSSASSMMYGSDSADVFFDYDSSNPMQWYSPAASSADVSGVGAGFGGSQDNWEFGNFDFTTASTSGSSPIKSSPLSVECYSPFQQTTSSSVASQDSIVDPSMPMLVERPYELDHHHHHQQLPAPIPQQHPHALHIQTTNLNWTDFSTSASSPMDGYALPHSQQQHWPSSQSSATSQQQQQQAQALTPYDYTSTTGGCSPTSPASECVSVQETHTPREGSADICGFVASSSAASSANGGAGATTTNFSFEGLDGYYGEEQKMMQHHPHHGMMPIDMDALNGALAPYMQV